VAIFITPRVVFNVYFADKHVWFSGGKIAAEARVARPTSGVVCVLCLGLKLLETLLQAYLSASAPLRNTVA